MTSLGRTFLPPRNASSGHLQVHILARGPGMAEPFHFRAIEGQCKAVPHWPVGEEVSDKATVKAVQEMALRKEIGIEVRFLGSGRAARDNEGIWQDRFILLGINSMSFMHGMDTLGRRPHTVRMKGSQMHASPNIVDLADRADQVTRALMLPPASVPEHHAVSSQEFPSLFAESPSVHLLC